MYNSKQAMQCSYMSKMFENYEEVSSYRKQAVRKHNLRNVIQCSNFSEKALYELIRKDRWAHMAFFPLDTILAYQFFKNHYLLIGLSKIDLSLPCKPGS